MSKEKMQVMLATLKSEDPMADVIVDTAPHVVLYKYDSKTSQWTANKVEGALFIYMRREPSSHVFYILNRVSTKNVREVICKDMKLQMQEPFILYRDNEGSIFGTWFPGKEDWQRIGDLMTKIIEQEFEDSAKQDVKDFDLMKLISQKHEQFYSGTNNTSSSNEPRPIISNAEPFSKTQLARPQAQRPSPSQNATSTNVQPSNNAASVSQVCQTVGENDALPNLTPAVMRLLSNSLNETRDLPKIPHTPQAVDLELQKIKIPVSPKASSNEVLEKSETVKIANIVNRPTAGQLEKSAGAEAIATTDAVIAVVKSEPDDKNANRPITSQRPMQAQPSQLVRPTQPPKSQHSFLPFVSHGTPTAVASMYHNIVAQSPDLQNRPRVILHDPQSFQPPHPYPHPQPYHHMMENGFPTAAQFSYPPLMRPPFGPPMNLQLPPPPPPSMLGPTRTAPLRAFQPDARVLPQQKVTQVPPPQAQATQAAQVPSTSRVAGDGTPGCLLNSEQLAQSLSHLVMTNERMRDMVCTSFIKTLSSDSKLAGDIHAAYIDYMTKQLGVKR